MKYKRIALVLACVLLFSGCQQIGTDIFVSGDTTKTGGTSDVVAINKKADSTSTTTAQGKSGVTTHTEQTIMESSPYKTTYFSSWEEYKEALSGVQTSKDLGELFSNNGRRVTMPMFLEDRFLVLPASKEHFRESCALGSQGYTMFLFVSEEKCSATVEIAHHKELFSQHNSSWHREEPYTTESGLEITAYTTTPSRKMYYTMVYGYPVRIDTYDACACIDDFVNNLTFEKVEIK